MFAFTRGERGVILFLISVALIGVGGNFLAKRNSQLVVMSYPNQDIGKVNINQADKDTLKGIVGIGEKLASEILDYRSQSGGFKGIEELKNIKGIGKVKFNNIKDCFIIE